MANLLQQRTLESVVERYSSTYGLPTHKGFLFFVIEHFLAKLEPNTIDIEEAIVDGSDDCGIDAVYIDEETEDYPRIYFFQSKYYESERAFEKTFEGNALDKIKSAIDDFVLRGKINKTYQNERLIDKLHSVKNLSSKNPRYTLIFCSNSLSPSPSAKQRLEEYVQDINKNTGADYLDIQYIHLEEITKEYIAAKQKKQIDINLQTSGEYLRQDTGNVRLFVGSAKATELATLVEAHGDDLFERNVRGYLRKSNPINKEIIATGSGELSPYFIYMNNGITITCEKFEFSPTDGSPLLQIRNAQIVNGQQTTRSLHQAQKSGILKDDVKVLIRVVETTEAKLLAEIIEATNSQTKVTSRDLHSNDEVQKLIERNLITKGYFYEARKDKYRGKDVSRRVDAEVAAQAYYASHFEEPALAKDKKKLLFGDKYEDIFTPDINPDLLLFSHLILSEVRKLDNEFSSKEEVAKKYSFLKDATLHTTALIYRTFKNKMTLENFDQKLIRKTYKNVIDATLALVKTRSEQEGDKYEHRRTFKDPETYGRIVEILERKTA